MNDIEERNIVYKTVDKDMKTINGYEYEIGLNEVEYDDPIKIGKYGLHCYKSLKNITATGIFYPVIFKARIVGGDTHSYGKLVSTRRLELLERVPPEKVDDNEWLYKYCKSVEDKKELWSKITEDEWIYKYCRNVKYRPEMAIKMSGEASNFFGDDKWLYWFCRDIKDMKEVWSKITNDRIIYYYCKKIKERKKLLKRMDDEWVVLDYLKHVNDYAFLRNKLKSSIHIYEYFSKNGIRKEMYMRAEEDLSNQFDIKIPFSWMLKKYINERSDFKTIALLAILSVSSIIYLGAWMVLPIVIIIIIIVCLLIPFLE